MKLNHPQYAVVLPDGTIGCATELYHKALNSLRCAMVQGHPDAVVKRVIVEEWFPEHAVMGKEATFAIIDDIKPTKPVYLHEWVINVTDQYGSFEEVHGTREAARVSRRSLKDNPYLKCSHLSKIQHKKYLLVVDEEVS